MPVHDIGHPLVRHKIGLLREGDISTKKFREVTEELARLLAYEASRDFELEPATIQGWAGPVTVQRIKGKKVTVVPILRAGLGMLPGVLDIIPSAKVSVVGLARDEATLKPVSTSSGSSARSTSAWRSSSTRCSRPAARWSRPSTCSRPRGCRQVRALVLVAAPEGIAAVTSAHPDVHVFAAAIDSHLNEHGYIIPGLGDAGDKIFGTKL